MKFFTVINFEKLRANNTLMQVWRLRYYTAALIAQKGTMILILPFLLLVFSRSDYANYVIFYSAIQIIGTISGLGVPLAFIAFWRSDANNLDLIIQSIRLSVLSSLIVGVIIFLGILTVDQTIIARYHISELALVFVIFLIIYNVNIIALGYARSADRSIAYLISSVMGAFVLIFGIYIVSFLKNPDLHDLIIIQITSLSFMTIVLFGKISKSMISNSFKSRNSFTEIFKTARPLAINTLVLLTVMSVDKWMSKFFFPEDLFSQYVIDYQAAFAIMFVPAAIGTYLGPRITLDNIERNFDGVQSEVFSSRLLCFLGCAMMSIVMYGYAFVFELGLSNGYWFLVFALIIEGQNSISSLRVMMQRKFSSLLFITMLGLGVYVFVLTIAGMLISTTLLYLALLINALVMPAVLCHGPYRRKLWGLGGAFQQKHGSDAAASGGN